MKEAIRRSAIMFAALAMASCLNHRSADGQAYSDLWGSSGERWNPGGRLPDFSYAGYRAGERPIPYLPAKSNVKAFGAVGDGVADDTEAFRKAIDATEGGAIQVPAGRYRITSMLKIRKSRTVLRGDGQERTILFFPKPLVESVGPGAGNAPGNGWSWSGGYLQFEGSDAGRRLAAVTAPARRGETRLTLSSVEGLRPGQWVRVVLTDADGSLARHLHAEQEEGSPKYQGTVLVDFPSPIEAIDGNVVVLRRPLRTDVRPNWSPALFEMKPTVEDVGVEDLMIEFPETPYAGHHVEPGFNAIDFENTDNCWARRVHVINADSGVFLRGARFCTAESLRFTATSGRFRNGYGTDRGEPQRTRVGGHHCLLAQNRAQDNLISDFSIELRFIHDLSVSAYASGNVFMRGEGIDLDIDHHRRAPFENLFTQLDAGTGARLWQTSGDLEDGPPAGARETFWNIRSSQPTPYPSWAPEGIFVAVSANSRSKRTEAGAWEEPIDPPRVEPKNLFLAQKSKRFGVSPRVLGDVRAIH